MSIVANSSPERAAHESSTSRSQPGSAIQLVEDRLAEVQNALWTADFIRGTLATALFLVAAWLAWIIADHWILNATPIVRSAGLIFLVAGGLSIVTRKLWPLATRRVDPEYAAHAIEADHPELRQSLTTYVTMRDHADDRSLRGSVVRGLANRTASKLQSNDRLPTEATGLLRRWLLALATVLTLIVYWGVSPKSSWQSTKRLFMPWMNIEAPNRVHIDDITPGDATVLAGREVQFTATVRGLHDDERAKASIQFLGGFNSNKTIDVGMQADRLGGSTQKHTGTLVLDPSASGELIYSVAAGDAISDSYRLTIQDVPIVELESVTIRPPAYTRQPERVQTSGAITAIQDTQVSITVRGNRTLKRAILEFNPRQSGGSVAATGGAITMRPSNGTDDVGTIWNAVFPLRLPSSRTGSVQLDSYRIKVWDMDDQTNPSPIIFPIDILEDLPPEVAIVLPQKTPKELPVTSQQTIEVHAIDPDFGLKHISLRIQRNRRAEGSPVLWSADQTRPDVITDESRVLRGEQGNQIGDFAIRPDLMGLKPGDLIRVVAVARDNRSSVIDPTIQPNERQSDPIELRIVAASDANPAPDDSDGAQASDATSPNGVDDGFGDVPTPEPTKEDPKSDPSGSPADESGGSQSQDSNASGGGGQSQSSPSDQEGTTNDSQQGGSGSEGGGESSESNPIKESGTGERPNDSGNGGMGQDGNQNQGNTDIQNNDPSNGGDASGDTGSDASTPDRSPTESPSHDGEAFERIEDYLNEKDNSGKASGEKPDQDRDSPKDNQNGETKSKDNSGNQSGNESDPQNGDAQTKQPKGDPSGNEGQRTSDASSDDQGNASENKSPSGQSTSPGNKSDHRESDSSASEATAEDGHNQSKETTPGNGKPDDASDKPRGPGDAPDAQGTSDANQASDDASATDPKPGPSESGTDEGQRRPSQSPNYGDTDSEKANASNSDENPPTNEGAKPGQGETPNSNNDARPSDSGDPKTAGSSASNNGDTNRDGTITGGGTEPQSDREGSVSGQSPQVPDPVDVDHAKKATDLVLDYLDKTRESPDEELLERLNWTKQDLDRFRDRWQRLRDLDQPSVPDGKTASEFEEALKSLGLRNRDSNKQRATSSGQSDSRSYDSGSRSKPPPAFRDAFESFLRNAGRSPNRSAK